MGPEVSRKPSTMKLTSKDVSHGIRQAVEIRPVEVRQILKCPLQAAHLQRKNAPIQEEAGETNFVNIDGDGSTAAKGNVQSKQQTKAVPLTAYKARSFMSSVDLGPSRRAHKPKTVIQHNLNAPPPSWSPEKPKVPEDVRMFLPKGIDSKDKPYVAPKFMPSYRDMMAPKRKRDPLVSIVEPTPPSMQKWAIEWNTEPKHISIAELREDIIRETAEKSHAPPENLPRGPSTSGTSPCFQASEAKQGKPSNIPEKTKASGQTTTGTVGKNQAIASDSGKCAPWTNLQIPTEYDPTGPNEPNGKRNLGKPLLDWVPPRFITTNNLHKDEYSFKEAVAQGMPVKANNTPNSNVKSKLPSLKSKVNSVYLDNEEQRFHKWFQERISAAVKSVAHDQPMKSGNKHGTGQSNQPADVKGISKLESSVNLTNTNGQSKIIEAEDNTTKSGMKESFTTSDGMTPHLRRNYPKVSKKASNVTHEPESSSSFCHWLKLRGHPIVKKEHNTPESKGSSEKIVTNNIPQNNTKFPWSVSYTLRKNTSTKVIPKRLAKPISKCHKSISQNDIDQQNKPNVTDSAKPGNPKSLRKSGKTSHKASSNRSLRGAIKKSFRSETKVPVVCSMNKIPKTDYPRQAASVENVYPGLFGEEWNIDSEVDHVNNVRRTEAVAGSSKATSSKKLFPPLPGPQMKYWESKYTTKPKSAQAPNLSTAQTPGRTKTAYNWYRSKKSTERIKSVLNDSLAAKHVENDRSSFSSIDEVSIPFKLDGNKFKDKVMDFSDDFDVDGFLCKEESIEKQLLDVTHKNDRIPDVKPQVVKGNEEVGRKLPVKESIKFRRSAQVRPEGASDTNATLRQRVQHKLDDDDLVMAFGEDPNRLEDLEWSEFIGPRNVLDCDADLTRILASQARQISSEQNSCL